MLYLSWENQFKYFLLMSYKSKVDYIYQSFMSNDFYFKTFSNKYTIMCKYLFPQKQRDSQPDENITAARLDIVNSLLPSSHGLKQ